MKYYRQQLKETAWKCYEKGYITFEDYFKICVKNSLGSHCVNQAIIGELCKTHWQELEGNNPL